MPLFASFALTAAEEALKQSAAAPFIARDPYHTAAIVGTGFGEINSVQECERKLSAKPHRRLSPYSIPRGLVDAAAVQISLAFGLKGPCLSLTAACATGSECIGTSLSLIRSGKVNIALCGAAESSSDVPFIHAGFSACKALAKCHKNEPGKSSRPFDVQRDGFVISEGAGILVLEEREHALKRWITFVLE